MLLMLQQQQQQVMRLPKMREQQRGRDGETNRMLMQEVGYLLQTVQGEMQKMAERTVPAAAAGIRQMLNLLMPEVPLKMNRTDR
jgi:hypothetical protein